MTNIKEVYVIDMVRDKLDISMAYMKGGKVIVGSNQVPLSQLPFFLHGISKSDSAVLAVDKYQTQHVINQMHSYMITDQSKKLASSIVDFSQSAMTTEKHLCEFEKLELDGNLVCDDERINVARRLSNISVDTALNRQIVKAFAGHSIQPFFYAVYAVGILMSMDKAEKAPEAKSSDPLVTVLSSDVQRLSKMVESLSKDVAELRTRTCSEWFEG